MMLENRPCHTLYVNNLNDHVKKSDLKVGLYYLFNQYGKVVDLLAMKTPRMRGQAFVSYKDIGHAAAAMRALQGFPLYDKPMRLQFAKRDSAVVRRLKGQSGGAADRKARERGAAAAASAEQDDSEKRKKRSITIRMMTDAESAAAAAALKKQQQQQQRPPAGDEAAEENEEEEPQPEAGESHNVLVLENLPEETTGEMLQMLFSQVDGFKEARCVDGRSDIAFVEYETDEQAGSALDVYQGFRIDPEHAMRIKFARK